MLINIDNKIAGVMLKKFLKDNLKYSRRTITRLYTNKSLMINDDFCSLTYILKQGDVLKVELDSKELGKNTLKDGDVDVVFEDEYLLIVNKPAGLCCHSSYEHKNDNLTAILTQRLNKKVYPVLRLDKNVSGLMLFAKTKECASLLNGLRQANKLNKYYKALVLGHFDKKKDRLEYNLIKDERSHKYIFSNLGKRCISDYLVLDESRNYSLLQIHILTGRSHQIRAGFAGIDHPIVSDFMYGKIDKRINRVCLHATSLYFKHPFTGENINIDCPLPKGIERLLENDKI